MRLICEEIRFVQTPFPEIGLFHWKTLVFVSSHSMGVTFAVGVDGIFPCFCMGCSLCASSGVNVTFRVKIITELFHVLSWAVSCAWLVGCTCHWKSEWYRRIAFRFPELRIIPELRDANGKGGDRNSVSTSHSTRVSAYDNVEGRNNSSSGHHLNTQHSDNEDALVRRDAAQGGASRPAGTQTNQWPTVIIWRFD